MRNKIVRKGLVLSVIVLFVGASVTTITGSIVKNHVTTYKSIINNLNNKDINRYDWWDEDWNYRKKIVITNPSSDYAMFITVWKEDGYDNVSDGIIDCENHCNDNFSDIRFIDTNESLLPYWIEKITIDGDHCARIWVKLSGYEIYYMYYDNPDASPFSNGDDTFIFFDHFDEESLNITKWDTSISGPYVNDYINSKIGFYGNWNSGGIGRVLKVKNSYMDFNIPVRVESRISCSSTGDIDLFVTFDSTQLGPDRLTWDQSTPGLGITIGGETKYFGSGFTAGNWHRVGGAFTITNHSVWGDWDNKYYKIGVVGSTTGYIGIGADTDDNNRYAYIDWFAVRKFSLNEPFISYIGTEEIENNPPNAPSNPIPADGETGVGLNNSLSWTCDDPDGDNVTFDVYFGTSSSPPLVASNQSETVYDPYKFEYCTLYYWQIVAWDEHGESTSGFIWSFTTICNGSPDVTRINGPGGGKPGTTYAYTFVSEDFEGDDVYYEINWGDGQVDPWDGPHDSNTVITREHSWTQEGTFKISARAKDVYDFIGDWGELEVEIPRVRIFTNFFLLRLLEHFQDTFPLLRNLIRFISIY